MTVNRVFLVGLSGAGKSTVGRALAERLNWSFADSDEVIEQNTGRSIEAIFAADGESAFRKLEGEALAALAARDNLVVATGGGAPTHEAGRAALATGLVVWLDITPEEAGRRLSADRLGAPRPLLAGDRLARLRAQHTQRRHFYQASDHSVAVDTKDAGQVAEEVKRLVNAARAAGWVPRPDRFGPGESVALPGRVAATVTTPTASYPIIVESGVLKSIGAICRALGLGGKAFVLTDSNTDSLFSPLVLTSLGTAGYPAHTFALTPGEEHKNLASVARVYDWLLEARVERSDFLLCLGGGVVTDLGGFAAATVLRGIPFVHVPTTMAGMTDAAIGGKTGVDHPRGKNLVGAFAQPRAVITDPDVLETLPEREFRAGCAELIKHGFILDRGLVADLERAAANIRDLGAADLIARSVAIKAMIVSRDEREAGERMLLNYGHTVGHALESVSGYSRFLHGEAVAIGMRAAGMLSMAAGGLTAAEFERQQALIKACGLPECAPGISARAVIEATFGDKKVRGGRVNWVLLEELGRARAESDVDPAAVEAAVEAVVAR